MTDRMERARAVLLANSGGHNHIERAMLAFADAELELAALMVESRPSEIQLTGGMSLKGIAQINTVIATAIRDMKEE